MLKENITLTSALYKVFDYGYLATAGNVSVKLFRKKDKSFNIFT